MGRAFFFLFLLFIPSLSIGAIGAWAVEGFSEEARSTQSYSYHQIYDALGNAQATVNDVEAMPIPSSVQELVSQLALLGKATSVAEAAILWNSEQTPGWRFIKEQALGILRRVGVREGKNQRVFSRLMHGDKAWTAIRVESKDSGPIKAYYRDTFKKKGTAGFTFEQRKAEYESRLKKFLSNGGKISDMIEVGEGQFPKLENYTRYDYVLTKKGDLRLYNTDESRFTKIGHSVLATGAGEFTDEPAIVAGEMTVLYNSRGETEVFYISGNSGHFIPDADDLQNAIPLFERFGVPMDRVVMVGGPNDLPAIFKEAEVLHGLKNLKELIPPDPYQWLDDIPSR